MNWKLKSDPSPVSIAKLKAELPTLSDESILLLLHRDITTFDAAKTFFNPDKNQVHDPFLMHDMDKAVDRLSEAFFNNEKILLYGDYDVDGTCSVSLSYLFLKEVGAEVSYYIPDRYKEGYGVSEAGVQYAINHKIGLVITMDCGIRATRQVKALKAAGIDTIVCDHHQPGENIPEAVAILDAKQEQCNYPYKELCGCGVVYKLLQAFSMQQTIDSFVLDNYIDLVATATCADIVPMTGENRVLVQMGIEKLNKNPMLGFQAILQKSGYGNEVNVRSIVFGFAPRINAAGRISHAFGAVELLTATDLKVAETKAAEVERHNEDRRTLDKQITEEALSMIDASVTLQNKKSTVLFHPTWHKGVIGIVASRCIEKYHKPTIILTETDGILTGSARSVGNFNILQAITQCEGLLDKYGGHKFAAGLSLKKENLDAFIQKFELEVTKTIQPADLEPSLSIDQELPLERINFSFHNIINRLEPFGPLNMQPIFMSSNLIVTNEVKLLKEEHLKFSIETPQGKLDCIGFGMKEHYALVSSKKPIDIAYNIDINEYRGKKSLQLMLRDIKPTVYN